MIENVESKKTIFIETHNPQWSIFFQKESQKIKSVMGNNVAEIYHVGSTSVPDLAAKPIIDIILVTRDLKSASNFLTSKELGYRYKGEYNLPLRDLYGKKDDFEIYLHVHLINSAEIELNLLFRDYLRKNKKARQRYESTKIAASKKLNSSEQVETGITKYNLLKNNLIVSILKKAGFSGICTRFVTQDTESKFFDKVKRKFFEDLGSENIPLSAEQNAKKIVLYEGVNLVGAAEISSISLDRFLINFAWTNDNENLLKKLLFSIETWIKTRTKSRSLEATVGHNQVQIYSEKGFVQQIESNNPYF